MPKVKKKMPKNKGKETKEKIFNFDEEVKTKPKKSTRIVTKKKNTKNQNNEDYFIGTKETPPISKKRLEQIKKQKIKEKKNKDKELKKIKKQQEKNRKKRLRTNKKIKLTEAQIKKNKRIKFIIKVILLIIVIIGIIIFLMLSPVFNIKNIIVEGNSKITSEQIISLSKIQKDENMFKVSDKEVKSKIKENPYIKSVQIKRNIPDKISIIVQERNVDFMLEYGSSYAYIDNQGYILEISVDKKENVPKISGYTTKNEDILPGNRLNAEDLKKLNTVIKIIAVAKSNEIDTLITTINMQDENNYTLYMEGEQKYVYLGDKTSLDTKMLYVKVILEKEKEHAGEIFVNMDLNQKNPFFREKV